ncbi:AfsR family transcriptional regulator, partial [Streptomyces sp. TRM76130]|nr:AfsR family transcriptional regulator [Streptomyces sp. TRM76130]
VRTVFEASYRALPEEAARMFRYLGLSPTGPITVQQAALLADTDLATTRRLLDVLADRHLLEQTSQDCYRFHGLIGIYAAECAEYEPKGHRDLACIRLRGWEDDFVSRRVAALERNGTPQVTMA